MHISSIQAALCFALFATTSPSIFAQVSFTITGKINEVSCTPTVTGEGGGFAGNTLTLGGKNMTDFNTANKSVAGRNIIFTLTGCGMSASKNNMWVHFTAASITNGRINTNHPQMQFQIRDVNTAGALGNQVNVGGTAAVTGPTSTQGTAAAFTGTFPNRGAIKKYAVRYYNTAIVTQAGDITANATYTVKYF